MNPVVIIPKASQSTNTDPDWRSTHRIDGIVTGVLHSCFGRLHEYKCLHFLSGGGEGGHIFGFHDELNISDHLALMMEMMTMLMNNNDNI